MAKLGPDISAWQGDIDILGLSNHCDFFIFRSHAGIGKDSKVDRNVNLAIQAGKPYGLYIYSYALSTSRAAQEAQNVINVANSYSVRPKFLVIDMEDADGYKARNGMPSNETLREICRVECRAFEQAGYYAMVYASSSWFNGKLAGLNEFDKWVAHWPVSGGKQRGMDTDPSGENAGNCGIWQFTSEGRLPGYNGNLDMNYLYKDVILGGDTPAPQPVPTKSIDELANEVLEGYWGNGDERRNRLTAAGYDYNAVQARVNEIANGQSSRKSNEEIADEVINGNWGVGTDRKNRLEAAGYDYSVIQGIVNQKLGYGGGSSTRTYTVKSGDCLSKIGAKLGVDWKTIANKNGIKSPYTIYPGQVLKY